VRPVLAAMALLVALAATAWADGVVIPSRAVVGPVRTPDQRALLAFDGTTETLVVETTLQGDGREFAWVVPLPAVPKVEASTTGLFPTLEVLTSPRVEGRDQYEWIFPIAVAAFLVTLFATSRALHAAAASGIAFGVCVLTLFVLVCNTISCDRPPGDASPVAVREIARERVGAFDVATIDPGDGSGLRRWLDEHGFAAPPAVDAVAADYARRGWVFVATKLTSEASSSEVRRVHPLAFTFPSKTAIYPMRLTLAANPECAVELFVSHNGTAAATGMEIEYSGPLARGRPSEFDVPHREIARRAGAERTLTKLVGTLRADSTADDLVLRFEPPRVVERVYSTDKVAVSTAATWADWAGVAVGLFVSIAAGLWRRGPPRLAMRWRLLAFASGPLATAIVFNVVLPTIPVVPERARIVFERDVVRLDESVRGASRDAAFPDVASARRWMTDYVARMKMDSPDEQRPREEDSPGNYTIRETDGRLEIVTYDGAGRETATDLREKR